MDNLEQRLAALRCLPVGPRPTRSQLAERNRRRRRRRIGAAVGVIAASGLAAAVLLATAHVKRSDRVATRGPVASTHGQAAQPQPSGNSNLLDADLAQLNASLERDYPDTYGGLVNTRDNSIDLYVTEGHLEALVAARAQLGGGWKVTPRIAHHTLAAVHSLATEIERARATILKDSGLAFVGLGIRIESDGPRVLVVGLQPDTNAAKAKLARLYGGSDWFTYIDTSGAVPQPRHLPE